MRRGPWPHKRRNLAQDQTLARWRDVPLADKLAMLSGTFWDVSIMHVQMLV